MPTERISKTLRELAEAVRESQHRGTGGGFSFIQIGPDDPWPEDPDDGGFHIVMRRCDPDPARSQTEVTPEQLEALADDPGDIEIAVQEPQSDDPVNPMGMPRTPPETPDGFTFITEPRDPLLAKHQQALRMANRPRPEPMSPELLFDDYDDGIREESSGAPESGRRRRFRAKGSVRR